MIVQPYKRGLVRADLLKGQGADMAGRLLRVCITSYWSGARDPVRGGMAAAGRVRGTIARWCGFKHRKPVSFSSSAERLPFPVVAELKIVKPAPFPRAPGSAWAVVGRRVNGRFAS